MSFGSSRRPRCVGASATYLNAGLWGSRFIGHCEVSTNGERVWLKGRRVPAWVTWVRVISYVAFLPVGFFTGVLLGETVVGHYGYPPYYYLASALLTFLLVVLGLWGAGIWTNSMSTYEAVSWPASKVRLFTSAADREGDQERSLWGIMNAFVTPSGLIQVQVPIGPGGKPRRLVLKAGDREANAVKLVLSGVYYGSLPPSVADPADPWRWSRN